MKAGGVTKPGAHLQPARIRLDTIFRTGQGNQRASAFIKDGHPHRQTARGEEVLHPNGLFRSQQRLQTIAQINRRQRIKIADSRTRPLTHPVQVVTTFILRRIAVFQNAFMQAFQCLVALDRHITQAKIRHAKILATNQEYAIQVVSRREVIPPVAHKPGQ